MPHDRFDSVMAIDNKLLRPLDPTPRGVGAVAMTKARQGQFERPNTPLQCFVPCEGHTSIEDNPRLQPEYADQLLEVLGLKKGGYANPPMITFRLQTKTFFGPSSAVVLQGFGLWRRLTLW